MSKPFERAINAIAGIKIPELPSEVLMLEQEINSKFASLASVASIIEMNTTLSGEVMRIVNSPVIKTKEEIHSIRDAVNAMGMDNIYNLVVSAALKNLFSSDGVFKDIMDNSVDVAFCMADIAEWVEGITRDEAYMLGLFHNVGAMMLAAKGEEEYESIYRSSMSLPLTSVKLEHEHYDTDHAMVGVLVGKKWKLSNDFLSAIMFHHTPECRSIKDDHVRALVAMIKVANGIVSEISLGAYRGTEMKGYEKDGIDELMIPDDVIAEIRMAIMSYSFKE